MGQLARPATADTKRPMRDYRTALEKLRRDAAEAGLIRDLATDQSKREIFDRLSRHLTMLADEVERVMATKATNGARSLDGFIDQPSE